MYDCYLFDFDYTLVDSTEGIVGCFQRVLKDMGRPALEPMAIQRTIGLPMPMAVGRLLETEDPALVEDFIHRYQPYADVYMTAGTHFYPDTLPTLRDLRRQGKKIAVISSKTSHRIQEKFDRDEVAELVDFVIGCREVTALKPDPEGIRLALSRFGLSMAAALYVGDSEVDAAAAKNAAVSFAGVTTGTTPKEVLARYPHVRIMEHLGELLTI